MKKSKLEMNVFKGLQLLKSKFGDDDAGRVEIKKFLDDNGITNYIDFDNLCRDFNVNWGRYNFSQIELDEKFINDYKLKLPENDYKLKPPENVHFEELKIAMTNCLQLVEKDVKDAFKLINKISKI